MLDTEIKGFFRVKGREGIHFLKLSSIECISIFKGYGMIHTNSKLSIQSDIDEITKLLQTLKENKTNDN